MEALKRLTPSSSAPPQPLPTRTSSFYNPLGRGQRRTYLRSTSGCTDGSPRPRTSFHGCNYSVDTKSPAPALRPRTAPPPAPSPPLRPSWSGFEPRGNSEPTGASRKRPPYCSSRALPPPELSPLLEPHRGEKISVSDCSHFVTSPAHFGLCCEMKESSGLLHHSQRAQRQTKARV